MSEVPGLMVMIATEQRGDLQNVKQGCFPFSLAEDPSLSTAAGFDVVVLACCS